MSPWKRHRRSFWRKIVDRYYIIKAIMREKDERMEPYLSDSALIAIVIIVVFSIIVIISRYLTSLYYHGRWN